MGGIKMKTIKILFTIAATSMLTFGCENADFLNCEPYSQTSPENFYKSESDIKMALTSCYEVITGHKIPGASYTQRGTYAMGMLYIMNGPSDDLVAATSSSDEGLEMYWGNYNESTRCIREFWKTFYAGINRCNTILQYVDRPALSDAKRTQYIAEARFMRAFFYYHLAWNFGGVPIVTSFASDGQEPRASLKDLYTFILDDLDFAYSNLNETGILTTSSANKYTAAAYIGRICNYLASCKRYNVGADLVAEQPLNDFAWVDAAAMTTKAKGALADVVEHSHYQLIDKYADLFRETTKADQYKECLLLAEFPLSGAEGYWPNSFYLPTPSNNGVNSPSVYGGRHVPTPRAFYLYSPNDARRDHNFTGRQNDGSVEIKVGGYSYFNPDPPRATVNVRLFDADGQPIVDPATGVQQIEVRDHPLYNSDAQTYLAVSGMQICPGKVRLAAFDQLQHTYQQHSFSYPLMRMADVRLMYAEALYFDNQENLAREQLDQVLRRAATSDANFAELKTYYHRDNFVDELLESRERELIFEFSRKFDLIRFGRIDDAISSLNEEKVVEATGTIPEEYLTGKSEDDFLRLSTGSSLQLGIPTLKHNWEHHKIWLPISEEQRGVNKNLTQNAGWGQ